MNPHLQTNPEAQEQKYELICYYHVPLLNTSEELQIYWFQSKEGELELAS